MSAIKSTGELSDLLSDFETEVTTSIGAELHRITFRSGKGQGNAR
jgi:hypothetical protein